MQAGGRKLIKNIGYMFIGNFASRFLSFLLVPLYTSALTAAQYGVGDLIFTTVTLLLPLFTLTIYEPMLRFSLEKSSDRQMIFKVGLLVAILGFGVLFLFSPFILLISIVRDYYWYCVAYYFACMLYYCFSYYARGIGEVKAYTLAGVVNTACMLGFNLLFLLVLRTGIAGYIWAGILSNLMGAATAFFFGRMHRYVRVRGRVDQGLLRQMIGYSVPMIPNAVSWWISNSSDRYMLTAMCGLAASGLYSVGYKIPSIISGMATIVNAAWQLSAVEKFGSDHSRRFFASIYKRFLSVLILGTGVVILLTQPIARLLYKAEFYEAWRVVPILSIAVIFSSLAGFMGTIFTAAKRTKGLMVTTLIGAAVNIALNLPLIHLWGMYGAAIATMISYIVVFIMRMWQSDRILRFERKTTKDLLSMLLLFLESATICSGARWGEYVAAGCFAILLAIRRELIKDAFQTVKNLL